MSEINLDKKIEKNSFFSIKNIIILSLIVALSAFSFGLGLGAARHFFIEKEDNTEQRVIEYDSGDANISYIFDEVSKSVVSITSTEIFRDFLSNNYSRTSQGSGVVIDDNEENLTIITNYHVVEGSAKILVLLDEETETEGTLLGYDEESDLAFISVNKENISQELLENIKTAKLGDSEKLKVGEKVLAIGSPLGYKNTVTDGIISGLQRNLNFSDRRLKLIQTNAAINPGNSGGALVNMSGEVIGINTVKIAGSNLEGLAFAIPINHAKGIYEEILEKGYVSRPFLGIIGSEVVNEKNNDEYMAGVLVRGIVEESAAGEAGIIEGDIIINFNGNDILDMESLLKAIEETKVGDEINVIVIRDESKRIEFKVTMKERK